MPNHPCKICQATTVDHAEMVVRRKHHAHLLRCAKCGFMFVDDPHWLAEAYAEPINRSDTGYVARNLWCRDKVCSLIEASQLDYRGTFLDYAAGYGLFVRLMRDNGYDFRWIDPYCQNLFSQGFEAVSPLAGPYEAITAFEVFEHLTDPVKLVQEIAPITSVFIFSTKLVPDPVPALRDWWYYGVEHGQHVAFYTRKSLELLAGQFGYQLVTDGADLHVFARNPISFALPRASRWRFWKRPGQNLLPGRPSLTLSDHHNIVSALSEDKKRHKFGQ